MLFDTIAIDAIIFALLAPLSKQFYCVAICGMHESDRIYSLFNRARCTFQVYFCHLFSLSFSACIPLIMVQEAIDFNFFIKTQSLDTTQADMSKLPQLKSI